MLRLILSILTRDSQTKKEEMERAERRCGIVFIALNNQASLPNFRRCGFSFQLPVTDHFSRIRKLVRLKELSEKSLEDWPKEDCGCM